MSKAYQLLFLTSQLPYPPQQGATIRSFNLLRELSQRADIDLLSFTTSDADLEAAARLRDVHRRLHALVGKPLLVLCGRIDACPADDRDRHRGHDGQRKPPEQFRRKCQSHESWLPPCCTSRATAAPEGAAALHVHRRRGSPHRESGNSLPLPPARPRPAGVDSPVSRTRPGPARLPR